MICDYTFVIYLKKCKHSETFDNREAMNKRAVGLLIVVLLVIVLFFVKRYFFDNQVSYNVSRQVRYSFTLKNRTNKVKHKIAFQVYAPVKQTATQIVKNIDVSHPYELVIDQLGNQILCFTFKEIGPYATEIIKIKANLFLSLEPNKIPLKLDIAQFVKPELYVESDQPDIVLKAESFKATNRLQCAKDILNWVANHINYSGYIQKEQGAYYAFKHKKGDCTEYMDLFTALCRAKNIPCKRVGGYVIDKNAVLKPSDYHNWVEFFDGKKWFCTGDIGKLIDGPKGRKFLKITDRKKELLKTSGGKYVAPAPIENRIKEDFLIEQMMVIGDKQKFVSALIIPGEEALKSWCNHKKMRWTNLEEMIKHPKVIKKYQKIIDRYNPEFSHIEQIKKFCLIASQWLPLHEDQSEAELTPTLKLKRRVIRKKFEAEIQEIYA